jgi:hypothetical protein
LPVRVDDVGTLRILGRCRFEGVGELEEVVQRSGGVGVYGDCVSEAGVFCDVEIVSES